ncbi:MAG TPA: hypothetical protein PKD64_19660 [Pirellulaceae bacterium]|nr:hypothetical protein [Pirellulaceae bacterium]HMP69391.1 hypothetical protein [Pirellulaceae bacterium]
MHTIIGTDEAGYGPNYGPLVIAATRWEVPDDHADLRTQLKHVLCETKPNSEDSRIEITDSKRLYDGIHSLDRLERGVLSFCAQLFSVPSTFSELLTLLSNKRFAGSETKVSRTAGFSELPLLDFELNLPFALRPREIEATSQSLQSGLRNSGIRLTGISIQCVFPKLFNRILGDVGNKANLLSTMTLGLVHHMLPAEGKTKICCDRHGGRLRYAGVIQHCLTDSYVKVVGESPTRSVYRWQSTTQECELEFLVKGESQVPVALAAMVAKYVRELCMVAWNRFWISHLPGLKPTAGYPVDARRFRTDIAEKQRELGIEENEIWRLK